jgi:hypothetical protein
MTMVGKRDERSWSKKKKMVYTMLNDGDSNDVID